MKAEQKRLYEHYMKLSKEGETTKQRTECKRYAEQILESFPEFKEKSNSNKEVKKVK